MTLDVTKPIQRRDGWAARIVCTDRLDSKPSRRNLVVLVTDPNDKTEYIHVYNATGKYEGSTENSRDIINIPVSIRIAGFINIYPTTDYDSRSTIIFYDETEANLAASNERIACIPVCITAELPQSK